MKRSDHWRMAAVGVLSLIAFALCATYLNAQSMWRDEVDAIRFANAPLRELFTNFTRPGWNGPLYFFLLRGWMRASGSGAYSVRFFSLLCGILCVPLTYVVGRRMLDRRTALIAAALAASAPYLGWYNLEAKMYTWVTALAILAVYALKRAFDEPGWHWWAVQIIATSLAAYSHIIAALLIPVQAVMYVVWRPRTRQRWAAGLVSGALLLLPYLPLLLWQAPLLLVSRATGFAAMRVDRILATLVTGWSLGPYPPRQWLGVLPKAFAGLSAWGLALTALIAVAGRSESSRRMRETRSAISLAMWTVLPALILGVISRWQPIFTDRYLIWCAPAFYLLVALGLESVGRVWVVGRLLMTPLTILLLVVNLLSSQVQLAGTRKADFRAVAGFIAGYTSPSNERESTREHPALSVHRFLPIVLAGPGSARYAPDLALFQIPHARYAFEYYYDGPEYASADGPFTNHRAPDGSYLMSEQELSLVMAQTTSEYDVVWLVATEVNAWDERRLTEHWLAENFRLELIAHFAHIDVHRYTRSADR